ncbi:hypothetical protein E5082_32100 [Streptomyces griseoluteus]|uniref:Transposase IS4-like domain-containing protein n=1 Tax=Streptomyces griseoluteus TaxID=29306 RepID=A0A4Z1CWF5_STRGP|nr:hypothetical protein E5082_32100 [Streptomyces griseoluteus]
MSIRLVADVTDGTRVLDSFAVTLTTLPAVTLSPRTPTPALVPVVTGFGHFTDVPDHAHPRRMQPVTAPLTPLDEAEAVQDTAQWLFPDAAMVCDGTWERLLQQVQAAADAADDIDWDISVDYERARAPSCRRRPPRSPSRARHVKGGRGDRTPGRDRVAKPGRPHGGGGAGGEGLGRSRGGFTSKIHLSADGRCRPLSLIVTPGQRADCTHFFSVLEKIRVPRLGPGRPRKKPGGVAADKAYSNGPAVSTFDAGGSGDPRDGGEPGHPPAQALTRWTPPGSTRTGTRSATPSSAPSIS